MNKQLTYLLLLYLILVTNILFASFPASPALVAMMEQCQKTYLIPNGTDFGQLSKTESLVYVAIILGLGMQTQKKLTQGNKFLENGYDALQKDIYVLFDWLVKKSNGIDKNGKAIKSSD